jgi:hypothetical protein
MWDGREAPAPAHSVSSDLTPRCEHTTVWGTVLLMLWWLLPHPTLRGPSCAFGRVAGCCRWPYASKLSTTTVEWLCLSSGCCPCLTDCPCSCLIETLSHCSTAEDHTPTRMFMPLTAGVKPAAEAKPADAKPSDAPAAAPAATAGSDYYSGWPDCWGSCSAGACTLDTTKPGCCYLNDNKHGYGGSSYVPYAEAEGSAEAEGYAHYRHDPERQEPGLEREHYKTREGYYNKGGNKREADLVCWGGAQA